MSKRNGVVVSVLCLTVLFTFCWLFYTEDGLNACWSGFKSWQTTFSKEQNYDVIGDISKERDPHNETGLNFTSLMKAEHAKERFHFRSERLRRICDRDEHIGLWFNKDATRYKSEWVRNDNFVIVREKSFLVCVLPKCGSTSWHWLARDMREPLSAGHQFGWQDRQKNTEISQELDPADGLRILTNDNGFRAIAVRHPFAKMISGWNDKLAREGTYGSFVLEAYPNMQKYVINEDEKHVIGFEDLAEYIADYGSDEKNLDYHFMTMQNLCRPCLYPYNYVIKLETLEMDENWLKNMLNVTNMPWEQKGSKYFRSDQKRVEVIRSYFRKVKIPTIKKLMKLYYYDFALFGYTFDVATLTAGGFI